eukprot:scaffold2552_cov380-Prasinococcus_capsulatus_cf.AAC.9
MYTYCTTVCPVAAKPVVGPHPVATDVGHDRAGAQQRPGPVRVPTRKEASEESCGTGRGPIGRETPRPRRNSPPPAPRRASPFAFAAAKALDGHTRGARSRFPPSASALPGQRGGRRPAPGADLASPADHGTLL